MNEPLPIVIRCRLNGITVEICHGKIPDVCKLLRFDPLTEPELPDTKVTDEEFHKWITRYRHSHQFMECILLEESQCN